MRTKSVSTDLPPCSPFPFLSSPSLSCNISFHDFLGRFCQSYTSCPSLSHSSCPSTQSTMTTTYYLILHISTHIWQFLHYPCVSKCLMLESILWYSLGNLYLQFSLPQLLPGSPFSNMEPHWNAPNSAWSSTKANNVCLISKFWRLDKTQFFSFQATNYQSFQSFTLAATAA